MKTKLGPGPIIFPMPAVLVGTYGEDGTPDAMTAAWAAACCFKPPCLGVAVRHSRLTYTNLEARGAFTINVPSTAQAKEVDYLGIVSGKQRPDKLAVAGLETAPGNEVDAPLITACPVVVECELRGQLELGSHVWFAGEVREVHADAALVGEGGALDIAAMDPLVYATSTHNYHALGAPVGAAYTIGKQLIND